MQVSLILPVPVPVFYSQVGVAVDLDSRQILFGTNGVWAPAFGEEALAVGAICESLATNAKPCSQTPEAYISRSGVSLVPNRCWDPWRLAGFPLGCRCLPGLVRLRQGRLHLWRLAWSCPQYVHLWGHWG